MHNRSGVGSVALVLACLAFAQKPAAKGRVSEGKQADRPPASAQPELKDLLESNVRAEWEAFSKKDKKTYRDLLAEDFVAVETDDQGARNKIHAVSELDHGNVYKYSLFAFTVTLLGPDAAFVTYESTLEFPPRAQIRFLRVYVSELWVKKNGQWKARHHQETRVR